MVKPLAKQQRTSHGHRVYIVCFFGLLQFAWVVLMSCRIFLATLVVPRGYLDDDILEENIEQLYGGGSKILGT